MPKKQKEDISPKKVVIGVSVGTEDFENLRTWTNIFRHACHQAKPGGSVYIIIGDLLQRHTLAIYNKRLIMLTINSLMSTETSSLELTKNISDLVEELKLKSQSLGKEWHKTHILEHLPTLKEIAKEYLVSFEIENAIPWQLLLSEKLFPLRHKLLLEACPYEALRKSDETTAATAEKRERLEEKQPVTNNDLRLAVLSSIEQIKDRFKSNRSKSYPIPAEFKLTEEKSEMLDNIVDRHCYNYLLEEMAVIMGSLTERRFDLIVYPAKATSALEIARDFFCYNLKLEGVPQWKSVVAKRKATQSATEKSIKHLSKAYENTLVLAMPSLEKDEFALAETMREKCSTPRGEHVNFRNYVLTTWKMFNYIRNRKLDEAEEATAT